MKTPIYLLALLLITCIVALPLMSCSPDQGKTPPPQPGGQGTAGSGSQSQAGSPPPAGVNTGGGSQNTPVIPAYATGAGTGLVEVHVTDAPPARKEITSVMITVSSIEIHTTGSGQDNQATKPAGDNTTISDNATKNKGRDQGQQQGGDTWVKIDFTGNNTFDLLKIKGLDALFAAGKVAAGKYTQVRLVIDQASVGFSDNSTVAATVPSGELKFVNPFDVVEGKTTVLTFDFDAEKSVTVTGQDRVMIKPVVRLDVKNK